MASVWVWPIWEEESAIHVASRESRELEMKSSKSLSVKQHILFEKHYQ